MLIPNVVLDAIVSGDVDLAFRRWKRPMHVPGGSQRTKVGVIAFDAVDEVSLDEIGEGDAVRAGTDLASLRAFLMGKTDGQIYRIALRYAGPDERIALRSKGRLSGRAMNDLTETLAGMDTRSKRGPWTRQYLELIRDCPGELAETIAHSIGRQKRPFKADVRRLKELGLTESLPVGYRLSPRGRAVLRHLEKQAASAVDNETRSSDNG